MPARSDKNWPSGWLATSVAATAASLLSACGILPKSDPGIAIEHTRIPYQGRQVRLESHHPVDTSQVKSTIFLLYGIGGMPGDGALLRQMAQSLARDGHAAVIVRYFDVTGHWIVNRSIAMRRSPEWRNALGAILNDYGKNHPDRQLAVAGFSLGGFLGLALAAEDVPLKALAILSGGILEEHEDRDLAGLPPLLLLHGENDTIILPERSATLARLAGAANVSVKSRLFPGEGHMFRAPARIEAIEAARQFFHEHLLTGQNADRRIISKITSAEGA